VAGDVVIDVVSFKVSVGGFDFVCCIPNAFSSSCLKGAVTSVKHVALVRNASVVVSADHSASNVLQVSSNTSGSTTFPYVAKLWLTVKGSTF
jgi:hypothetical protein